MLERGWRRNAPKKLVQAAAPAGASSATAGSKGKRKKKA